LNVFAGACRSHAAHAAYFWLILERKRLICCCWLGVDSNMLRARTSLCSMPSEG
jgi:hypothetical protein